MTAVDEPRRGAPITGLSHVQLVVSDVGVSARWYRDVLGLVLLAEDPALGYVALRHREAKVVVVLTQSPEPRRGARAPTDQRLDHLAFAVPDGDALAAWAAHLTEIGMAHDGTVRENGHPSLQLRDPDGIAIELVAP
ncbi:MAG: VOC family protein [Acidimicrobiales bacterium]